MVTLHHLLRVIIQTFPLLTLTAIPWHNKGGHSWIGTNIYHCWGNICSEATMPLWSWALYLWYGKTMRRPLPLHFHPLRLPLPCFLHTHWHAWRASTGSNTSPLFMDRVHLRARLTDQKMLMIGGGGGGCGDGCPHLLEMAILLQLWGHSCFQSFPMQIVACPTL